MDNSRVLQQGIRLGHVLGEDHTFHLASLRLAQKLSEKTEDEWKLNIISGGRLGSESDLLRMVSENQIEMALISTVNTSEKFPKLNVFSLPYAFDTPDAAIQFLKAPMGKRLIEEFSESTGIHCLSFLTYGVRDFATTKRPILGVEDLVGLSFRIPPNPIFQDTYEAFDALPRKLDLHEVLPALRNGILDGTDIAPSPLWGLGYHEVIRHMSLTGLFVGIAGFLVSGSFWESLGEGDRAELIDSAHEAAAYALDVEAKQNNEAMENLKAAGLNFYYPDPTPFKSKVLPVWERAREWLEKDIIDELQTIGS